MAKNATATPVNREEERSSCAVTVAGTLLSFLTIFSPKNI
jgi:hypothetical protein